MLLFEELKNPKKGTIHIKRLSIRRVAVQQTREFATSTLNLGALESKLTS